ncbi:MAG TPA: CPBP family intramembrane glutamic endopeptidase [Ktedonobacteraceae bacterium]|nr:CPBP family intramembrane glutamic endopeptidase [Ktedonobacteraceae bacterium]
MSSVQSQKVVRSTVASTWKWMWPDVLMRIIPMGAAPFLYIAIFHLPLTFLGLTFHNAAQQLLIGLLVGVGMAGFAAAYRMLIVGPWFRWPTVSDHLLQGFFYLFINGPVEELFFRGFLLAAVTQWTGWIGWGWLVSTVAYTLYHRLGKWSWRSVGGVGLAGLVFSLLYILQPTPRSLLAVIIVHGFTTAGFLSWGDEIMYRMWKHKQKG